MNTWEFLRRVIPPDGNYFSIAYPRDAIERSPTGLRSFPVSDDGFTEATGFIQWLVRKQADVWHAVAAYENISPPKQGPRGPKLYARRNTSNVQSIKCLIIDQDVKREGDKKSPDTVFSTRKAAATWLVQFTRSIGLPLPNLGVGSGYGLHWYWLLENALSVSEWKPLAEALRAAMTANGWTSDTSPTIDAARLLRPPDTFNYKDPANPRPVYVLPKQAADYPNDQIVQALTPWLNTRPRQQPAGPTLGPKPAHLAGGLDLNAAAALPPGNEREFSFVELSKHCAQAAVSMAKGGEGEEYPLWRSHALTCTKCVDGRESFHNVSRGDERYTPEETDATFDRTCKEAEEKLLGATRCETYNQLRPGICPQCQYWGQIPSPLRLGAPDSDLPDGYRRAGLGYDQRIERITGHNGKAEWDRLFPGDVHSAQLDELEGGGHQLCFIYQLGSDTPKSVVAPGKLGGPAAIQTMLAGQGMNVPTPMAPATGVFLVAWMQKIQRDGKARTDRSQPYGWNWHAGNRLGAAIAGDHYLCAGGEERVAGGDPRIAYMYRPHGSLDMWRQAASLFEGKRPDLQIPIGFSFASPLLSLCGDVHGMTANFFSAASGIGKTSAFKVGQTIWGSISMMSSMQDTPNAVMKSMSEPKIFPRYWDEFTLTRDTEEGFNAMIFHVPQGKERARMQSDTQLREVRTWCTFLLISANRSYNDVLLRLNSNTDAGLLRLLEFQLPKDVQPFPPGAGQIISQVEANYGWAGRVFLRHVASNHQGIQDYLIRVMTRLGKQLGAQQEERFYITAMACVLVGCGLARTLKLFDFDMKGVYEELKKAFYAARSTRHARTVITVAGTFDLGEIVSSIYSDMANERLVTNSFGHGRRQVVVTAMPQTNKTWLQLSSGDKRLRILTSRLFEWLSKHHYPTDVILDQLKKHGATISRQTLGGGTRYSTGQQQILDIPLTGAFSGLLDVVPSPVLSDYDDNDDDTDL